MISRLFRRGLSPGRTEPPAPPSPIVRYRKRARYGILSLTPEEVSTLAAEEKAHRPAGRAALISQTGTASGNIKRIAPTERGAEILGDAGRTRLEWIAADCLRISRSSGDAFVVSEATDAPSAPLSLEWADEADVFRMSSGSASCMISKRDGSVSMRLGDGPIAYQEILPPHMTPDGRMQHAVALPPGVMCSGFGAHVNPINVRGMQLDVYSSARNGFIAPVPFMLLTAPDFSCGVFWRTSAPLSVDAGRRRDGELTVTLDEEQLDYTIMVSSSPVGVLARFSSLLPSLALPPLWALGLHVGGDAFDSAHHVNLLMRELRDRGLPVAALQLGGMAMDDGRPLTLNAERFLDLSEMVDNLHQVGIQVILEVHPAIRVDETYPLYASGTSRSVFAAYADGTSVRAAAAMGISVFPDFMREEVRTWWAEQMRPLVRSGIDGIGVYSAGPDVIREGEFDDLPEGTQHQLNGAAIAHSSVRSRYSGQMSSACCAALEKDRSALRSFVRQASGGTEISQYGALSVETAGDWDGLKAAVRGVLNAGVSGIHLAGLEIDVRDGEMMVRAMQAGALMPSLLMTMSRTADVSPWRFDEEIDQAIRETLTLRTRLLSYLYTCVALAREYGAPIIRPLWMFDPANASRYDSDDAFMIGDHVLAAPVLSEGTRARSLYLPHGLWYNYWTNEPLDGGTVHQLQAPLNRLPLLVRAGAVLRISPDMDEAGGRLRVYAGSSDSTSYDDAGEGYSYLHGDYRWVYHTCRWETNRNFVVTRRRTGGFFPSDKRLRIEVVGLGETPDEVRLDRYGAPLWYFDQGVLEVVADDEVARVEAWLAGSPTSPTRKRRAL